MNILNKFKLTYLIFLYVTFFLSSLFDRSFMGIYIFGFRVGEIIVGVFFLQSLFVFLLNKKTTDKLFLEDFYGSLKTYKIIIFIFLLSLLYFQTSLTSTYTYKTSSYIWLASIVYVSYYLHQSCNFSFTNNSKFVYLYATLPIVHYLFSSGYYPDFIMIFFNEYSDKFTFTKASDIMLVMIISCLLLFGTQVNKKIPFVYFAAVVPLLLPLLLEMSRGSFFGAATFFLMIVLFDFKYLIKSPKFLFVLILISSSTFLFSTYRISGIEFNSSQNSEVLIDLSVTDNLKKIAKKQDTRKAFLSFYIEDGRLVSHDNTTNWRLDIWQDVVEDLNKKNLFLTGYGYNEIIPVMTDPSAPGRLGRDGLNENVHSYVFNILARGGIFQLILFAIFHFIFIRIWYSRYKTFDVLLLMIPIFINSATDMNMEGVQFPFIYYFFLGMFYKFYKNDIK